MPILNYQNFYLVGIKGVAMTSIAQCLADAGKNIAGSDVVEDFVTAKILKKMDLRIDDIKESFEEIQKKEKIDALIYTAAHNGIDNHQVKSAQAAGIPIFSQAEALGELFNQKKGIAVCGVGGKSSISAMISFILEKIAQPKPSFSVGVGEIIGMEKTGQWLDQSEFFVAEADEYVVDPHALEKGQKITPRFSFLKPYLTVCSNLKFDHPDVYKDFSDSKKHFKKFFQQINDDGFLIINGDNLDLIELSKELLKENSKKLNILTFGQNKANSYRLSNFEIIDGLNSCQLSFQEKNYQLQIKVPGDFNLMNAAAAIAAVNQLGFGIEESIRALAEFRSTKRRFELVKEENGKLYYDDYAHHPSEVKAVIESLKKYYPNKKKLIAFQSHTYSRTKKLFADFVDALGQDRDQLEEIVLIDIFPSARETQDDSVSSDLLVTKIKEKYKTVKIQNLKNIDQLADYVKKADFDVFITIGAGDIYEVYQKI
jgi:UDP-N-acetylmuramate--alanine ligase